MNNLFNLSVNYSFLTGLEKTVFRTVVIAGPMLIGAMPETWMNLTLGAALTFLINFAKNAYPTEG